MRRRPHPDQCYSPACPGGHLDSRPRVIATTVKWLAGLPAREKPHCHPMRRQNSFNIFTYVCEVKDSRTWSANVVPHYGYGVVFHLTLTSGANRIHCCRASGCNRQQGSLPVVACLPMSDISISSHIG